RIAGDRAVGDGNSAAETANATALVVAAEADGIAGDRTIGDVQRPSVVNPAARVASTPADRIAGDRAVGDVQRPDVVNPAAVVLVALECRRIAGACAFCACQ